MTLVAALDLVDVVVKREDARETAVGLDLGVQAGDVGDLPVVPARGVSVGVTGIPGLAGVTGLEAAYSWCS